MNGELAPKHIRGGGLLDDTRMGKCGTVTLFELGVLQQDVAAGRARFGRPFLIVCPKDVLRVWVKEHHLTLGEGEVLKIVAFDTDDVPALERRGTARLKDELCEQTDVIITTISMLAMADNFLTSMLRHELTYRAVICDEAHNIHNEHTQGFQIISALRADAKWYVTGTPIQDQNSLCAALRFMGVSDTELRTMGGEGDELNRYAQQLVIRRTMAASEHIPWQVLEFTTPLEYSLYVHMLEHTLVSGKASRTDRLRVIHYWRSYCVSPYLCLELFRDGTVPLPPNVIFLPSIFPSTLPITAADADDDDDNDDPMEDVVETATVSESDAHYKEMLLEIAHAMTLEALGIETAAPPLLEQLRPYIVPPVSAKERWVVDQLLSNNIDLTLEKGIIFSNWRSSLDRLGHLLDLRLLYDVPGARRYVYVHGKMSASARNAARDQFATDPHCGVMLAMIDVNCEGIDLTCANHAVIYDPWWNPVPEYQAISRIKGPTQTRPMYLYRLIMDDTNDEKVAAVADRKKVLDQTALPPTVLEQEGLEESMEVLQETLQHLHV